MVSNFHYTYKDFYQIRRLIIKNKTYLFYQYRYVVLLTLLITVTIAQRAPFAGKRPAGYKDRFTPDKTNNDTALNTRFGENEVTSSTPRLPYDAIGDAAVVDILNRRPVDQRPFWLINYEAIEAHRNGGVRPLPPTPARPSFAGAAIQPAINDISLTNRLGTEENSAYNVISQQEIVYPLEYYATMRSIIAPNGQINYIGGPTTSQGQRIIIQNKIH